MISAKCQQCGFVNRLADEACHRCGAELSGSAESFGAVASEYQCQPTINKGSADHSQRVLPTPAIGPFLSISDAIGPTFELFKDNLWLITKIVFVVFAPLEILKTMGFAPGTSSQMVVGTVLLGLFAKVLVAPSLIYALVTVMRTGIAPGINESYRWGLSSLGRLSVCALLAWLLEGAGFLCFIIPGFILGAAFELVYPMATLEDRSPVEILKRSYELTKGYRWRIFWASLLLGIVCAVANIPMQVVSMMFISNGINFWPFQATLAMVNDIVNELMTVLSLVIYLSIVGFAPGDGAIASSPAIDPQWR